MAKTITIRNTTTQIHALADFKDADGKDIVLGIEADDTLENGSLRSTCQVTPAELGKMQAHPAIGAMFRAGQLRAGEILMM